MVSDKPLPDRCGGTCVEKHGLEFTCDELDETYVDEEDDGRLQSVVLSDGSESVTVDAHYEEVRDHLHTGWNVTAIVLSDSEGDESDETTEIQIESDEYPDITNTDSHIKGYCEKYPSEEDGKCRHHTKIGSGAPEGNTNGMTHGLKAKRSNYYDNLSEEDKDYVEKIAESLIDDAPFGWDKYAKVNEVYRIAIDLHRLSEAQEEFDQGIVYEQEIPTDDGVAEVVEENPANLPYDRLDRTTTKKMKELGILSDPESQKAEAVEKSLTDVFTDNDT